MKHRNVHRVDTTFHGYMVYVTRGGKVWYAYVSDMKLGGRRAALREALRVRGEIEASLPPRLWIRLRTRNDTGVPGVTRIEGLTRSGRRAVPRYQAFWIDGAGRRRTRAYSVSAYGEAKAFSLAVEARRRGVLQAMEAAVRKLGYGKVPDEAPGLDRPSAVWSRRRRCARSRRLL